MTHHPHPTSLSPGLTVAEAVACLQRSFAKAGLADPGRDARIIVQAALGLPNGGHILHSQRRVGLDSTTLAQYAERRLAREPVSRILSERGFYGREFAIAPATLDPRPDTETVITAALELLRRDGTGRDAPLRILDIGTGSGCILLTLLAELPMATGLGTDISVAALDLAAKNATRLATAGRASFAHTDILPAGAGAFDLVVSNPPYISTHYIPSLEPEVRLYDPHVALDGGPDGLTVYRAILAALQPGQLTGWCVLEVGYDQAAQVKDLVWQSAPRLASRGTMLLETFLDHGGHTRCVAWKAHLKP